MSRFIIDVIPITPLPINRRQYYSYLWDTELPIGTLVSVFFSNRIIEGIVIRSQKDFHHFQNIQLKKIQKVIEENFLEKKQIELAQFISDYYFSSLGTVLKFFIPKRVKERRCQFIINSDKQIEKIKFVKEQKIVTEKILKNYSKLNKNPKFLLHGPTGSGKTKICAYTILKLKDEKLQFLILVPELLLAFQAVERYSKYFNSKEIVLLHGKMPKGQFYSVWQKIKSGEAKIIIGLRLSLFAPFQKLGLIIIEEEQEISYKQWDMNPRYDARKVAEKLSELHQCPIIFKSTSPSIISYWRAINKEIILLKLPVFNQNFTTIDLVDMRKEKWNKNYSIISKKLENEIEFILKKKLQIILFVNRQGVNSFSICIHCQTVLRCPQCERALTYDYKGYYKCFYCSYKTDIFPKCFKCQGTSFKNIGIGTQQVEKEITKLFKNVRLKRVDSDSMKKVSELEKFYRDFSKKAIDVLIGTQIIIKGWNLPNMALAGIINIDNLINLPDFNAEERVFHYLFQIIDTVTMTKNEKGGKVLIQTYYPEHSLFQIAAKMDYLKFYQKEIKARKELFYPPFGQIIKIICRNSSKDKVEYKTKSLYQTLTKNLDSKNILLFFPQDSLVSKIRKNFQKQIIIKIKKPAAIEELAPFLRSLGKEWIIDIDPISII